MPLAAPQRGRWGARGAYVIVGPLVNQIIGRTPEITLSFALGPWVLYMSAAHLRRFFTLF